MSWSIPLIDFRQQLVDSQHRDIGVYLH